MRNFLKTLLGIFVMTALTIIVPEGVEAQLGKIHRKYAQVTVSPEVVTQGDTFFVTVQPWIELGEWKLVVGDDENELASKSFIFNQISQHTFELPAGTTGAKTIHLMGKENGQWRILLEKSIEILPGFYDDVQRVYAELLKLEEQQDMVLPWIYNTMAHVEDLLERMKSAESGQGWDLRNRLQNIKEMIETLKEGKDPYAGKTGYLLRGYRSPATGEIQLFSSYLPKDFHPSKKYPTVIMLHGAWSNHHLAMRRVLGKTNNRGENDAAAKRTVPQLPDVPYIVLAPNGHETMGYFGVAEDDISLMKMYFSMSFFHGDSMLLDPIDENRTYLTGLSMGGGGTGKIGIKNPSMFAAIAPVCGYFNYDFRDISKGKPDFIKQLIELKSPINMVENLLHVPVKLMHGAVDPVVPVEESQNLHKKLRELDYHAELEIYPGVGHDAWTDAYKDARIFDWFSQFERNPYPKQVRFKTATPNGAYWINITELAKIRDFASVDAEVKDGEVLIETNNVKEMALQLSNDLLPLNKEYKFILDDTTLTITPAEIGDESSDTKIIILIKNEGNWQINQQPNYTEIVLQPTLDGLYAPVTANHKYVYGSNGTGEEVQQAKALAMEKAFWGDMTDVNWDVMPEDQFAFGGFHPLSGVVLFSKINNSSYIQKNIDNLPISVKGERIHFGEKVVDKDQGFIFVYRLPEHNMYVTVCTATTNEGMEALETFAKERFSFLGNIYGDFVCMNKDGKPIWGGLFDKNWTIETVEDYE